MTAADWQAIAEWVTAGSVVIGVFSWLWHQSRTVRARFTRWWSESVSRPPKVSIEAGIACARTVVKSGHPPYTVTRGPASPEQPLDYLLAKTAEVVWEAITSAQSELEPHLVPLRSYMIALAARAGLVEARDFALGILAERVRQEENGWPDSPGDPRDMRSAHGTGGNHSCLLERKHQVEDAIYRIGEPA